MSLALSGGEFWARFTAASLATWRVGHLFAYEDGPWDLLARLRAALGPGFWGKLMDCFYCLSLWVAALFAPAVSVRVPDVFLLWLGLSGAACLLERVTAPAIHLDPAEPPGDPGGVKTADARLNSGGHDGDG
jgi:Protein of unknown function (DUF1360)